MAYSIINKKNNKYYNSIDVEMFEAEEYEGNKRYRGYLIKNDKGILYMAIPIPNLDEDLEISMLNPSEFKTIRIKPDTITTI